MREQAVIGACLCVREQAEDGGAQEAADRPFDALFGGNVTSSPDQALPSRPRDTEGGQTAGWESLERDGSRLWYRMCSLFWCCRMCALMDARRPLLHARRPLLSCVLVLSNVRAKPALSVCPVAYTIAY